MTQPLCGQKWLDRHYHDHSQEDIDALTIVISFDSKKIANIGNGRGKGKVKAITKFKRSQGR